MANEFKVKKGLIVDGTGTVLDIQGTLGQLFSVTDSLTGDLFSVADISGVPILNVNSSGSITADGSHLTITDGNIHLKQSVDSGFTSGLTIERSANTQKLHIGMDGGAVNFNSPDGLSYKFRNNGTEKVIISGAGNVSMATGHSSGKFAVMSTSVHGSYDFYNNGTSYFNGAVSIDSNITQTGATIASFHDKVGVGTQSPYAFDTTATKLHVKNPGSSGSVVEVARFEGSSDGDGSGGVIRLTTSNDRGMYFQAGRTGTVPYAEIGTTEYDGAKTLALTIANTGNVTFAGEISQVYDPGNTGAFQYLKNPNAGNAAYVSKKWQNNDSSFGEIWRNSSARTSAGQLASSFNMYNGADINFWSGGTHTLSLIGNNATVVGTIAASNFSGSSSGTNTGDQDLRLSHTVDYFQDNSAVSLHQFNNSLVDAGGNYNATAHGGASFGVAPIATKFGTHGLNTQGDGVYVDIAGLPQIQAISLWYKAIGSDNGYIVDFRHDAPNDSRGYLYTLAGNVSDQYINMGNDTTFSGAVGDIFINGVAFTSGQFNFTSGNWYHIVITTNNTSAGQTWDRGIRIGNRSDGSTNGNAGYFDQVRTFSRRLVLADVKALYAEVETGATADQTAAEILSLITPISSTFLKSTTASGTPGVNANTTISIGDASNSYAYVQSHGSKPLNFNPSGNAVQVAGSAVMTVAGGTFSGNVAVTGSLSNTGEFCAGDGYGDRAVVYGHLGLGLKTYPKVAYPGRNAQYSRSSASTGQIVIDLPGTLANYDMMYMEIDIYEYSAKNATKLIIGGHNWNSGGNGNANSTMWHNAGVTVLGDFDKAIRFGRRNDGTNERRCIALGEVGSTWSYVTVHVAKVTGAASFYGAAIDWLGDWNIGLTTSTSYFTSNPNVDHNSATSTTFKTRGIISSLVSSGSILSTGAHADAFGYNATNGRGHYIKGTGGQYLYGGGSYYDGSSIQTLYHTGNLTPSTFVTLTGAETISGNKTFTGDVDITKGAVNGTGFASNRLLRLQNTSTTDGSRMGITFQGNSSIGSGLAWIEGVNDDQSAGHTSIRMSTYNGSWHEDAFILGSDGNATFTDAVVASNLGSNTPWRYTAGDEVFASHEHQEWNVDSNANYKRMAAITVAKNGTATIKFEAYIHSGSYYWSYAIARNNGTNVDVASPSNQLVANAYTVGLAAGVSHSVHAYRQYDIDVAGLVAGDQVELWMRSSTSPGAAVTGNGQKLYAKKFRMSSVAPTIESNAFLHGTTTISHVAEDERYGSESWSKYLTFDAAHSGGGGLVWSRQGTSFNRGVLSNHGDLQFVRTTSDSNQDTSIVKDLVILNSGKVGIGNPAPGNQLVVKAANAIIDAQSTADGQTIGFRAGYTNHTTLAGFFRYTTGDAQLYIDNEFVGNNAVYSDINLRNKTTGGTLTTRMKIKGSTGNVGIGTGTGLVGARLQVESDIAVGGNVFDVHGTQGQLFNVTNNLTGDLFSVSDISGVPILNVNSSGEVEIDNFLIVSGPQITIHNKGNDTSARLLLAGHNNTGTPGQQTNAFIEHRGEHLKTVINHNGTDVITIGTSTNVKLAGNIQLGNNSNAGAYLTQQSNGVLHVQTIHGSASMGPANGSYCHFSTDRPTNYFNKSLTVDTGVVTSYDENLILRRSSNSSHQVTISTTAATFTHDVVAYSDKKLKENIKTLDGSKVLKMRGVSFDRIDTGLPSSGVIAQEIQEVAPELVSDSDGTLGVSYGNLVGYLIEAVKDQQKQIDELKKLIK